MFKVFEKKVSKRILGMSQINMGMGKIVQEDWHALYFTYCSEITAQC
jgi:hypothetical protein